MLQTYPFIIPIGAPWLLLVAMIIVVFYTRIGLQRRPILNRSFLMKFSSLVLFFVTISILITGTLQLFGVAKGFGGKSAGYWHALSGYVFVLFAINHIIIHLRDIKRYIFKPRPPRDNESDK